MGKLGAALIARRITDRVPIILENGIKVLVEVASAALAMRIAEELNKPEVEKALVVHELLHEILYDEDGEPAFDSAEQVSQLDVRLLQELQEKALPHSGVWKEPDPKPSVLPEGEAAPSPKG